MDHGVKSCGRCSSFTQDEPRVAQEEDLFENLPEHLIVEVMVRVPVSSWTAVACTRKRWAALLNTDELWRIALHRRWPQAARMERWPGPIGRGCSKRRYKALYASQALQPLLHEDEVAGHVYLYLKEQLESSTNVSYSILHGTIVNQFLACQRAGNEAQELASQIWVAVIDNLEETEETLRLLLRLAGEWEVFLPYPFSKSHTVQWKLFERLFTGSRHLRAPALRA